MKVKYEIEIEVDEVNIARLYPNFRFNYNNDKHGCKMFGKHMIQSMIATATNYNEDNVLKEFGFEIRFKELK